MTNAPLSIPPSAAASATTSASPSDYAPPDAGAKSSEALFNVALYPHRSLSKTGFLILMAAIGTINFIIGMVFMLNGAWPVLGFCGLDVLLVYIAFQLNYRDGRAFETLRLTSHLLTLEKVSPSGHRQNWRFQPYWLRVVVENTPRPGAGLALTSHGRHIDFAAFLTDDERLSLAEALKAALGKTRS